jgi:hypothetical protein
MGAEEKGGSMWTWVAVGCGGFILLGVAGTCVGPGIFAMMLMDQMAGMGAAPPMPGGPGVVGTAGLELPPAEGPLRPLGVSAAMPTALRTFRFVVSDVQEIDGVAVGDTCNFAVERLPRGDAYWCRTEVTCGEVSLYGGPGQGYFDCSFPETEYDRMQAYDYSMQENDGDPSFVIDYDGTLTIRDHVDGTTTVVVGTIADAPPPPGAPVDPLGEP